MPPLAKYSGDPNTCSAFFNQLKFIFLSQPIRFTATSTKVAYLASLLEGPPLGYLNALNDQDSPLTDYDQLVNELKKICDHPVQEQEAGHLLLKVSQGTQGISGYVGQFRMLAMEWNDDTIISAFKPSLQPTIIREVSLHCWGSYLDETVSMAIEVSHQDEHWSFPIAEDAVSSGSPEPEPMQ